MRARRRAYDAPPTRIHSIPSAGGAISRLVCERLREAKFPLTPLLAKAGLTGEQIDDPSCPPEGKQPGQVSGIGRRGLAG